MMTSRVDNVPGVALGHQKAIRDLVPNTVWVQALQLIALQPETPLKMSFQVRKGSREQWHSHMQLEPSMKIRSLIWYLMENPNNHTIDILHWINLMNTLIQLANNILVRFYVCPRGHSPVCTVWPMDSNRFMACIKMKSLDLSIRRCAWH